MCNASYISEGSFNVDNLLQHRVVDAAFEADTVAKSQADIDRETLKISIGVNIGVFLHIVDKLGNAIGRFEVDEG